MTRHPKHPLRLMMMMMMVMIVVLWGGGGRGRGWGVGNNPERHVMHTCTYVCMYIIYIYI